jgi:hypothetical protein
MATIPTELTNAQITLVKLRTWARSIARLSLVMMAARSLAEWDDAQTYMAELLEQAGDAMDQTTPEEQGFVGNHKKLQPKEELLARGDRLWEALHNSCGLALYQEPGEKPWEETE